MSSFRVWATLLGLLITLSVPVTASADEPTTEATASTTPLEEELEAQLAQIQSLQEQLAAARSTIEAKSATISSLRNTLEAREAQLELVHETPRGRIAAQLAEVTAERDAAMDSVRRLLEDIRLISSVNEDLQARLGELDATAGERIVELTAAREHLESEVSRLATALGKAQGQIAERDTRIAALEGGSPEATSPAEEAPTEAAAPAVAVASTDTSELRATLDRINAMLADEGS